MLVVVVWLSSRIPNCTLKRSAGRILVETGWKTLFWLNCCERKTLFRLKKEAEQVEYGVSRTGPFFSHVALFAGLISHG